MEIAALQEAVVAFADARHWQSFHDPKNLAMALASEVGELNAILRWVPSSESDDVAARPEIRARLEREIGDVAILLLLLCERTQIELAGAVNLKLRVNAENYPVEVSAGRAERPGTDSASHQS
jgi:dCTP diphosphatase